MTSTVYLTLFIFMIAVILFGVVGNILSFVTWSVGKRCRHLPVSCYFKPLAIIDTFILLVPASEFLVYVLSSKTRILLREMNVILCKFFGLVISSSWRFSMWITVALSFEKVCRLYMPFRFRTKHNTKRIYAALAIIWVVAFGINVPTAIDSTVYQSIYNQTSNDTENGFEIIKYKWCAFKTDSFSDTYLDGEIHMWIDFFTIFTLPVVSLLICNSLILAKMIKRSKSSIGTQDIRRQRQRQTNTRHTAYQVLAVSVVHCVTTTPYFILTVPSVHEAVDRRISLSYNGVFYLNNAVNFLLYCSIGSDFRKDLIYLIKDARN